MSRSNYSPVIFGSITILAVLTWWFTPEEKWLPSARLGKLKELEEEINAARMARSSSVDTGVPAAHGTASTGVASKM